MHSPPTPAGDGPRGAGCDPSGHRALRLVASTCLPLGQQLSAAGLVGACSCLRPAGSPPAGCVLQTTYRRGDGLGAQMYIRQSHLAEAAQLGCTWADAPLDEKGAGQLAHATKAAEVRAFFNLGSATARGSCPADAPTPTLQRGSAGRGGRRWCDKGPRDLRQDPKAASRLRRAPASGAWCSAEYPPMEMSAILFDAASWLRGRALMRARYLSARDARPPLARAKRDSPWFGGPPAARHARGELHLAAHIRRGDVSTRHFRYVPTARWSTALLSLGEACLSALPQHMHLRFVVVTEPPWGAANRLNVSAPLAALNRTAAGGGRVHYAERVGGDPLEAFAHLVAADVLAASDSHFSIAAAQLSLGVQLRIRRQGFAAVDVQHMIPLPLMRGAAAAAARVRVNRNRGCAEDEEALAARSRATFECRLRGYYEWRASQASVPSAAGGGNGTSGQECVV